jgi:hypothetical protein
MDRSSKLALGIGDQIKSAGKAEQDREQRPNSIQFSSKLIVSKLIFPSWLLGPQKEPPSDRSAWGN